MGKKQANGINTLWLKSIEKGSFQWLQGPRLPWAGGLGGLEGWGFGGWVGQSSSPEKGNSGNWQNDVQRMQESNKDPVTLEDGLLGDGPHGGCSDQHSLSWEMSSPSSNVFSENGNIPTI